MSSLKPEQASERLFAENAELVHDVGIRYLPSRMDISATQFIYAVDELALLLEGAPVFVKRDERDALGDALLNRLPLAKNELERDHIVKQRFILMVVNLVAARPRNKIGK